VALAGDLKAKSNIQHSTTDLRESAYSIAAFFLLLVQTL
jgi:hypothetical protein